jgi:hypothetical protein
VAGWRSQLIQLITALQGDLFQGRTSRKQGPISHIDYLDEDESISGHIPRSAAAAASNIHVHWVDVRGGPGVIQKICMMF